LQLLPWPLPRPPTPTPLHLGMCLAACRNLTSIELAVCKDFATEVVMIWQIMIWEQAQAGDRAGKTRRRLQR
jgi:hypothetical protein